MHTTPGSPGGWVVVGSRWNCFFLNFGFVSLSLFLWFLACLCFCLCFSFAFALCSRFAFPPPAQVQHKKKTPLPYLWCFFLGFCWCGGLQAVLVPIISAQGALHCMHSTVRPGRNTKKKHHSRGKGVFFLCFTRTGGACLHASRALCVSF